MGVLLASDHVLMYTTTCFPCYPIRRRSLAKRRSYSTHTMYPPLHGMYVKYTTNLLKAPQHGEQRLMDCEYNRFTSIDTMPRLSLHQHWREISWDIIFLTGGGRTRLLRRFCPCCNRTQPPVVNGVSCHARRNDGAGRRDPRLLSKCSATYRG